MTRRAWFTQAWRNFFQPSSRGSAIANGGALEAKAAEVPRGLENRGNSLYRQVLDVPLVISFPGRIPAGQRVRRAVSLRDLAATLVELAELEGTALPGESLAHHWDAGRRPTTSTERPLLSASSTPRHISVARQKAMGSGMKSLVAEALHYIQSDGEAGEELYDFESDPLETRNLAASAEGRRWLRRLRDSVEDLHAAVAGRRASMDIVGRREEDEVQAFNSHRGVYPAQKVESLKSRQSAVQ